MKLRTVACMIFALHSGVAAFGQNMPGHNMAGHQMELAEHGHYTCAIPVTYEQLTKTAELLQIAERAAAEDHVFALQSSIIAFGQSMPSDDMVMMDRRELQDALRRVSQLADQRPLAVHQMGVAADDHDHACTVTVTQDELTKTAQQLETAKRATAKYRDIGVARSDGYSPYGIYVPGMGIHYAKPPSEVFDLYHPDVLLYERNGTGPEGYALVAVSYFFNADADAAGQPKNPPFAKSLAIWHRHTNLCVFSDHGVTGLLTEAQCKAQGGRFMPFTAWMMHAWIWKDNPLGVFSMTNPNVQ